MPDEMFFSIVTVTYNNIAGLKATGGSIDAQSFKNYEWIVIDGGSKDGSADWLKGSGASYISEPDEGIYHAMNKGIKRTQGQYLLFLNAGDTLAEPGILENLARAIENEPKRPDFVYGDSIEGGKCKPAHSHTKIVHGMFTHHQAMLYARETIGDLRYSPLYDIAADYDFTARFLKRAKHVLYQNSSICIFEPGGVSQQKALKGRAEQFQIRKNLGVKPSVNTFIFITQSLAWGFRKILPSLYWKAKSKKS